MRRRRPEEERAPASATNRAAQPTPAGDILALQQSAGNQAVTQMLSREAAPAREPATADVDGVGVIVLESWSVKIPRSGSERSEGAAEDSELEVHCTARPGAHSGKLLRHSDGNSHIAFCNLEDKGYTFKLKDCLLTGYTISSGDEPVESWSLLGLKQP